jgi:hypothetical protein
MIYEINYATCKTLFRKVFFYNVHISATRIHPLIPVQASQAHEMRVQNICLLGIEEKHIIAQIK